MFSAWIALMVGKCLIEEWSTDLSTDKRMIVFYNYSHYINVLKLAVLTETLIKLLFRLLFHTAVCLSVCTSLSYSFFLYLSLFFPSLSSLSVIFQWLGADNLSDSRGLFFFFFFFSMYLQPPVPPFFPKWINGSLMR